MKRITPLILWCPALVAVVVLGWLRFCNDQDRDELDVLEERLAQLQREWFDLSEGDALSREHVLTIRQLMPRCHGAADIPDFDSDRIVAAKLVRRYGYAFYVPSGEHWLAIEFNATTSSRSQGASKYIRLKPKSGYVLSHDFSPVVFRLESNHSQFDPVSWSPDYRAATVTSPPVRAAVFQCCYPNQVHPRSIISPRGSQDLHAPLVFREYDVPGGRFRVSLLSNTPSALCASDMYSVLRARKENAISRHLEGGVYEVKTVFRGWPQLSDAITAKSARNNATQ